MTPHGRAALLRWVVAGCGRHRRRRRHIEDVCSLANAYSKSVLVLFTINTRVQAYCFSVPLSDERTKCEGEGKASAVAEGGNICKKKKQCKIIHMN